MDIALGILVVILLIGGVILYFGYANRCPNCKKMFARQLTKQDLTGQEGGYRTVRREDIIRDNNGNQIERRDHFEQVHVVKSTFHNYFTCKYCQHTWEGTSTKTVEG